MDWLQGMNQVVQYIEAHLTEPIPYEALARIVGCSLYEFSRIFSFMAGILVSEYIRRRRLSQAVFDLREGKEKIIDIALKYGYESPTTFARAFKSLHGARPSEARDTGVSLKTYPPISFVLTIKGVNAMEFRIVEKESFQIMGLSGYDQAECESGDTLSPLWREFMDSCNPRLWNGGDSYYTAPFWQVGAYSFEGESGRTKAIIGAEYKGRLPEGLALETVPAAAWAVFTITSPTGNPYVPEAYARILTEWFPTSQYTRDKNLPSLEVFPGGDASAPDYQWEIWMPLKTE